MTLSLLFLQQREDNCLNLKQVRKLRWSVAFVILQNCDSVTYLLSDICVSRASRAELS